MLSAQLTLILTYDMFLNDFSEADEGTLFLDSRVQLVPESCSLDFKCERAHLDSKSGDMKFPISNIVSMVLINKIIFK